MSIAQIMRAVLLAIATAATLLGLRERMSANQGSNTERHTQDQQAAYVLISHL